MPHRADPAGESRRFVPVDALAAGLGALPAWETSAFAAELDELDRAVDDRERDPWSRA